MFSALVAMRLHVGLAGLAPGEQRFQLLPTHSLTSSPSPDMCWWLCLNVLGPRGHAPSRGFGRAGARRAEKGLGTSSATTPRLLSCGW
eukprot:1510071-Pyramimonas_sp.AAC.1